MKAICGMKIIAELNLNKIIFITAIEKLF